MDKSHASLLDPNALCLSPNTRSSDSDPDLSFLDEIPSETQGQNLVVTSNEDGSNSMTNMNHGQGGSDSTNNPIQMDKSFVSGFSNFTSSLTSSSSYNFMEEPDPDEGK